MASHPAPVFQPICLGRCRSSWLSSTSVKPRQPVKDSCTTLRKLSAARALRSRSKTLESNKWRFATKPNHDASAKCAANARFLSFPKAMEQRTLFVETGTIFKQSIKANEA